MLWALAQLLDLFFFSLSGFEDVSVYFFVAPVQQSCVPSFQSRITAQLLWLICHVTPYRTAINKQYQCVVAVLFWSGIRMHVCLFDVRRRLYQHIFSVGRCSRLCHAGICWHLSLENGFSTEDCVWLCLPRPLHCSSTVGVRLCAQSWCENDFHLL